jgi:hypothetical protein
MTHGPQTDAAAKVRKEWKIKHFRYVQFEDKLNKIGILAREILSIDLVDTDPYKVTKNGNVYQHHKAPANIKTRRK